MLLSFAASAEDPISGGRHKVIGSKPLSIPPQTSTIASHLPKAVGAAFSIGIARTLKLDDTAMPRDSVVLASFGDASANHSTAQGAFNTAAWAAYQGTPMPLIFLCEDNGIGISTQHAARLDRGLVPRPAGASLRPLQRPRHGRRLSRRARGRRFRPPRAQAGLPAHGYGAALRPCRLRSAGHLPDQGADRGGRGARPPGLQRGPAGRAGPAVGRADPRHLQRDRGKARPDRRAGDHAAEAHHQPGGDGEHRAAEARRGPSQHAGAGGAQGAVRARPRHDGQAPAYGAPAELGARRSDAGARQYHRRRRGCRAQGRRLQRHRQAARALRLDAGDQHLARRAEHPRPRHRRRA